LMKEGIVDVGRNPLRSGEGFNFMDLGHKFYQIHRSQSP